jgi:hypothetical protein
MTTARLLLLGLLLSFVLDPCTAQQEKSKGTNSLWARLSYTSTYVADGNAPSSPHICLELQRSGRYRISKLTKGAVEDLQGKLSQEQVRVLAEMLDGLDFASSGGALVRRGSESFVAEIVRGEENVHLLWIDPDHERPLPKSAARVVRWLQEFRADGARPLMVPEYSANPICPRMSDNPLQPLEDSQGCSPVDRR